MTERKAPEELLKRGRKTIYDPTYCDAVIEFMAKGKSIVSFAASIEVSRATINVWMAAHPEFLDAVHVAKAKCASWWEDRATDIAKEGGGPGAATMTIFGLRNMAPDDWTDKQLHEHSGKNGGPIALDLSKLSDDALAEIERAVASDNAG